MSPQSYRKPALGQQSTPKKKQVTSMSCRLEPAIWSRDIGQQIPCFDRCQWIITWLSNIKLKYMVNQGCMSLSTYDLEYGRHVARLHRRRRRAYAPTSNTAAHDNHEKINSRVSFSLYGYGALLKAPLWWSWCDLRKKLKFWASANSRLCTLWNK